MPTNCPGQYLWVDVHATRFNVDGIVEIIGRLRYDESVLHFITYRPTEWYSTSSNVDHTATGELTFDVYNNANYRAPSEADEIVARLLFSVSGPLASGVTTRIRINGAAPNELQPYSDNPTAPPHHIPDWESCRRDSDVSSAP
jgi:hypothetical protein